MRAISATQERPAATRAQPLRGFPVLASAQTACAVLERETRGTLGVGNERVTRCAVVWVPSFLLTLGVVRVERHTHEEIHHSRVWGQYDALEGTLLARKRVRLPVEPLRTDTQPQLPALLRPSDVADEIRRAAAGLLMQREPGSALSHAAALQRLGVLDASQAQAELHRSAFGGVQIDLAEEILMPAYVAIAEHRDRERAIAVDGLSGRLSRPLSELLTRHLPRLHAALDR